jgi:hypothetical protein
MHAKSSSSSAVQLDPLRLIRSHHPGSACTSLVDPNSTNKYGHRVAADRWRARLSDEVAITHLLPGPKVEKLLMVRSSYNNQDYKSASSPTECRTRNGCRLDGCGSTWSSIVQPSIKSTWKQAGVHWQLRSVGASGERRRGGIGAVRVVANSFDKC